MLVKDFIDETLTSDNFNKMVVNLIGHFSYMIKEIEHNRPEFSQIMESQLLWTHENNILGAQDFPTKYNSQYKMYFSTAPYEDDPTFLAFKAKLTAFQKAVAALPSKITTDEQQLLDKSTLRNLFPVEKGNCGLEVPQMYVSKDSNIQVFSHEDYGFDGKRDLDFYDMFNTGIYSFEEIAYYELNKEDGTAFTKNDFPDYDIDMILGQLLVFMTRYGYTEHDFEDFVENFNIIG